MTLGLKWTQMVSMWNDRRHLLGRQGMFLPVGPSSPLPQYECSSSVLRIHKTSRDAASFQGSILRNSPAVDAFLQLGDSAEREAARSRGTGSPAALRLECRRGICQRRFSGLHTDSLCSLLTWVLRKHDLELMCSGRNRLGDFRLLLPLPVSPLFADGAELLKGWEHAVVRREFSAPPSKPAPWPTESTWRPFLRFLRDDIVICTWNCIIHRMTLWDGISAK